MMILRGALCVVLAQLLVVDAKLQRKGPIFSPSNDLENLLGISLQDRAVQEIGDQCFHDIEPCDRDAKYRSIDGSCNNLIFPMWGLTNSPAIRARPPAYADNKTLPRLAVDGGPLPNSRTLRTKLIPDFFKKEDKNFWLLFQGWAQFISHDVGHSTPKESSVRCCTPEGKILDPFSKFCLPIQVPKNDTFYSAFGVECIEMFRAKTTKELGCHITDVDLQIVDVTHYIDGSQVYGSEKTVAESIRLFENGLLRYQLVGSEMFPPNEENPQAMCDIREEDTKEVCYKAGDRRANQNVVLTPIHILFVRIHNMIAQELSKINPQWKDEITYQETRRIVGAIIQLITYKEFLPILVGTDILKKTNLFVAPNQGLERGYDKFMNPSTVSEFMNTAYRSLHTICVPKVKLVPKKFRSAEIDIVDWMDRPQIVERFYTQFMRGQQLQFIQAYDKFEPFSVNNKMFSGKKQWGRDLEAISIQRQLDFGTPSYNAFREYSRLPRARTFDDLRDVMNQEEINALRSAYASVDDVDLFTGGLYERPVPGALVGVTFWKIIVEQFFRWKFGDRYFFTFGGQAGSFTPAQLAEILKVSSGWLFCAGTNNIGSVHPNNMDNTLKNNEEVPCSALPKMDLTKWKAL